ncbi:hypothetical protein M404DRAFT_30900 [Pisolithus tinctorius Marx 270]|uniref:Uncharacterized protein n=1 Tax=Pisolithus tinctorius Marx 270 TaxID=870435 RepID=A0A0C3NUP7_PISTI|nr:hypothetical protein M404DRAFT_30900 [Pisolithus tinctorius Marx 270]
MSELRLISMTDNNDKGKVIIDWTQVLDDAIRYDTNNEEEVMKAKSKERKRQKAAEQAWQEEQTQLEAKRVEREKAEAERAEQEAEETRVHEDEERCKAKEEREAKQRHKAKASKGDEAGGEVKKVVMDPGQRPSASSLWMVTKSRLPVQCNQSKGKCQWPGDGKDIEAGPKAATKVDKGKKWKANEEMPEPGPSKKKAKVIDKLLEVLDVDEDEAGGSRLRGPGAAAFLGLEDKLECLINITGLIAKTWITNVLGAMLDKSYSFRMAVSPSDLGPSELDSDELCEEANWLKAHGEDKEEESGREDETMAKAK